MSQSTDLIFLDAGIFIGALLKGDPRHPEAYPIVEKARQGELLTVTSVGVLSEVYAALTWIGAQPPQSPDVASQVVSLLVEAPSAIQVLETNLEAGLKMLELAATHRLTARRIHDARHAATAIIGGISRVYTYDVEDWQIFESDGIIITGSPIGAIRVRDFGDEMNGIIDEMNEVLATLGGGQFNCPIPRGLLMR